MADHDPFNLDMFGSSALSSGLGLGVTANTGEARHISRSEAAA